MDLTLIMADIANLRASEKAILSWGPQVELVSKSEVIELLGSAVEVDSRLVSWLDSIPSSWIPIRVSGSEAVPQAVQDAGLYQKEGCDTYPDLYIASTWNSYRWLRVIVRSIILKCNSLLSEDYKRFRTTELAIETIQRLVDDICRSVPFHLGSRTNPSRFDEPDVKYPHLPGSVVSMDHYKAAAALGGWMHIAPFQMVMGANLSCLREGQLRWIGSQMLRIAKIYKIKVEGVQTNTIIVGSTSQASENPFLKWPDHESSTPQMRRSSLSHVAHTAVVGHHCDKKTVALPIS